MSNLRYNDTAHLPIAITHQSLITLENCSLISVELEFIYIIAFKTDGNNTEQSPTVYYKTQNHPLP